MKTVIITDFV